MKKSPFLSRVRRVNFYSSPTRWKEIEAAQSVGMQAILCDRASSPPNCRRCHSQLRRHPCRLASWGSRSRSDAGMRTHVRLLALPLRVQLGNRRPDRESPRENREVLELFWHHVACCASSAGTPALYIFSACPAMSSNTSRIEAMPSLAANLAVTWDKERVLIEPGEFLQRVSPA